MAKQAGPPFYEGVIGGLLYYKMNGGYYVRPVQKKIGKKRFQTEDRFARSRENAQEFSHLLFIGKLWRNALNPYLRKTKYRYRVAKLIALLGQVKNCDGVSVRGQRNVHEGFKTITGRSLIAGHDFNLNARFQDVVPEQRKIKIVMNGLSFDQFSGNDLKFPSDANEAHLTGVFLVGDSESNLYKMISSDTLIIQKDSTLNDYQLQMQDAHVKGNFKIILLSIVFYQRMANGLLEMSDLEKNVLTILGFGIQDESDLTAKND